MTWKHIVLGIGLSATLCVTVGSQAPLPPRPYSRPTGSESDKSLRDPYQRSLAVFEMRTSGDAGAPRGEEIYYYKCWICHNQYAKTGPQLAGIFTRTSLVLTGEAVNDRTVEQKIRTGGPAMPAYGATLTSTDLTDLLSYLKSAKCCFDAEEPPPNPAYKAR